VHPCIPYAGNPIRGIPRGHVPRRARECRGTLPGSRSLRPSRGVLIFVGTGGFFMGLLFILQAGPPRPGTWEPFAPMTDEFDGPVLDESKWHPRNPDWPGRPPAFFNPKNVSVREGMLHLEAKKETLGGLPKGYHTFTTAAVKSRTKVRYGYFEIRARAMDSQASSAFWFYDRTPEIWSEIDVFEIGARPQPHRYYMNTHLFHTLVETVHWHKSRIWEAPYNLSREFHVYGLEWDRDAIRWTVDGYHAVGIEVLPPIRRPRGTVEVLEFRAEEGTPVRVTVRH